MRVSVRVVAVAGDQSAALGGQRAGGDEAAMAFGEGFGGFRAVLLQPRHIGDDEGVEADCVGIAEQWQRQRKDGIVLSVAAMRSQTSEKQPGRMRHHMNEHTISESGLRATVRALGAELCSFQGPGGEMLWQAGPVWPRHAPVLFPIVGRLKNDVLRHEGREYRMTQHGFARDRAFAWGARATDHCRLVLTDDEFTRAMYPFAFRFEMEFRIADGALCVTYRTVNTGDVMLPASQGAHPAFRWPLTDGVAKEAHFLTFEADETALVPRLESGLLGEACHPSPIVDRVLALNERLFAADAIVLPAPASRWVRYIAPGTAGLEMRWEEFPSFGIWMRPPGNFLCLEPWAGMTSPVEWDGDFVDKPGVVLIAPGDKLVSRFSLRVLGV